MSKTIFNLSAEAEFIPLDKLLKILQWVGSGGEAHLVIQQGLVRLNSEIEFQKRKKIRNGDVVEFNGQKIEIKS